MWDNVQLGRAGILNRIEVEGRRSAAGAPEHGLQGRVGFDEDAVLPGQGQPIGVQQALRMHISHHGLIVAAAAREKGLAYAHQGRFRELGHRQSRHARFPAQFIAAVARDPQIGELQILAGRQAYGQP
jgi:hypothetical protein